MPGEAPGMQHAFFANRLAEKDLVCKKIGKRKQKSNL